MLEAGESHPGLGCRAVAGRAGLLVTGERFERLGLHLASLLALGRRRRMQRLLEGFDQLARVERLRDVLQRALDAPAQPRFGLVGGGDHEYGDLGEVAMTPGLELLEHGPP